MTDTSLKSSSAVSIRRPLNRKRLLGLTYQALLFVAIIFIVQYALANLSDNLSKRGLNLGLDFLAQEAGFEISFTAINYASTDNYWRVFLVGIVNTLLVTVIAIFLSTIVGFAVGIARLSSNWALSRAALLYVEIIRNLPQLLHLLIWYNVALHALPVPRTAINLGHAVYLSNRGIFFPSLTSNNPAVLTLSILVTFIAAIILFRKLTSYNDRSGSSMNVWFPSLVLFIMLPVTLLFLTNTDVGISVPELKGFNFVGGWVFVPELTALVFAMTIYNAAFIAELVRASIQSVHKGQRESAAAIGFKWGQTLRYIIIPQAMRVLLPPLSNQYLNILKGSSLAVAIGYPDLVGVFTGISINQTGRAIEIVSMTMAVYLLISLTIGACISLFNRMTRIVER
ncbi:amino acid ABC transporter permease [Brucellaceae bacterium C25G]